MYTVQYALNEAILQLVRIQSAHLPGYNPAIASSIREGPIRSLAPTFASLGRNTRKRGGKVLLIWVRLTLFATATPSRLMRLISLQGTKDSVVPYHYAARVQALISQSELVTIDGAKHDLTLSHAEEVTRHLLRFFADDADES